MEKNNGPQTPIKILKIEENFPEITPSENPDMELYVSRAYDSNPGSKEKKEELVYALKAENFDQQRVERLVKEWNDTVSATKGFEGQHGEIESISGKHNDAIEVHHYRGSDSIRFAYTYSR